MKGIAIGFILLLSNTLIAQKIEGTVVDQINGELLVGASFSLNGQLESTIGDPNGSFQFEDLPAGLHSLEVHYLGYKPFFVSDIWVKNGKTTFLKIEMIRDPQQLDEVMVKSAPDISKVSAIQITEEKINRVAASYNDPARLAQASSDAIVTHDQNNQISVRGLSPSLNVWRLEGVEIVNPNHLSNAGTFNDQPASTGGGVNILSAQMLDKSEFLVGQMDNTYSNGVAGIFDMNLRNGYKGDHQFTAQASFIGFDFSAEGPFSSGGKASYLANYRYSFTGLLGLMGVDFNGETIGFQDLSFNVNIPLKNKASIKVFALGGISQNDFKAKSLADSETQKDRSDILFQGKMGAIGSKYELPVGKNIRLSVTSVFSMTDDLREETGYNFNDTPFDLPDIHQQNSIWSSRVNGLISLGRSRLDIGTSFNTYAFDYTSLRNEQEFHVETGLDYLAPYANWQYALSESFTFNSGLTYYYLNRNDKSANQLDYRVSLSYEKSKFGAGLSFGKYSQIQMPYRTFVRFPNQLEDIFYKFGILSSLRYIANIQYSVSNSLIKLEGFYYDFPEVSEVPDDNQSFFGFTKNAKTYGSSLNISGMTQTLYYDLGFTLFNSTFNNDVDNPYNVKQSFNASLGAKKEYQKGEETRTFSVNVKGLYQGGLYQLSNDQNFKGRLNDYARLDLRFLWIKNKSKSTTSWSLDIQNITNRENEAFQFYDSFTGQIETNYQLGLIPILTYRIEF